jgi:hypothetical protein
MKEYSIDELKNIVRPQLGEEVPLLLFRILRIIGIRKLLGETSGATLYMMGKNVGNMVGATDIEDLKKKIEELKVGIAEVETIDEGHMIVKLRECITCAGFGYTGETFCDMESGIIAGLLERIFKKKAKSTQTKSWSVGYNYCEFEIFLY